MKFAEFRKLADAVMRETLADAGFRRTSAGKWNRRRGDELNVIHLQAHSVKSEFCVNLGVHYTFMPRWGSPGDDRIDASDCLLKLRLTSHGSLNDQWWPIVAPSTNEVVDALVGRGLLVFDSYRLGGPISGIDGRSIESGDADLLTSVTDVRACLFIALMHEHLGNRDKSIEAADIRLKLAGMAIGPKKALRDILKRLAHPG
ncbi:MAG: DUF4304 domain-containing protein [Fimbriimonadaceae bacterium]|nr:DUF4304 domain-containing protein [Fimbriimonadaceae bacterium]